MKNEFYDIAFRKKIYNSIESLQSDVDQWIESYNRSRPHSGIHCYGKTPMQTFKDSIPLALEKNVPTQNNLSDNNSNPLVAV